MIDIVFWIVPVLFVGFTGLDVFSIYPRIAGSVVGKNGIGYSYQVMVNTLKRVFAVLYPPLLGYLGLSGDVWLLLKAILLSYFFATFIFTFVVFYQRNILIFLCGVLSEYGESGRLISSLRIGFASRMDWEMPVARLLQTKSSLIQNIKLPIFFAALWIFFFYSGSPFMINILGVYYSEYASVILQLSGLSSALGTIALAFFLDPKLSFAYERGEDLFCVLKSLLCAHFLNLMILGPLFFLIIVGI